MNALKLVGNATLALMTALTVCGLQAQARYDGLSWQPKVGEIGSQEEQLARQLTIDFHANFIDTNELAMLTRDLDSIRVKEDALRMNHHGLTKKDEAKVLKMLAKFQSNLNNALGDKSVTIAEMASNIPSK